MCTNANCVEKNWALYHFNSVFYSGVTRVLIILLYFVLEYIIISKWYHIAFENQITLDTFISICIKYSQCTWSVCSHLFIKQSYGFAQQFFFSITTLEREKNETSTKNKSWELLVARSIFPIPLVKHVRQGCKSPSEPFTFSIFK